MDILLVAEYALTEIGGYDVLICDSGKKALEEIERYNPDLIVLDVMMPELDGPETLSKIRNIKSFKFTPAIFITAKAFPNEIAELKLCDYAVIDVIPKPFDPITISQTIQSIWEYSFSEDDQKKKVN